MKTYEFWRERATGQVWAIELRDGVVSGCIGPLEHAAVDDAVFDRGEFDRGRAEWVESHRDAFDLHIPSAVR